MYDYDFIKRYPIHFEEDGDFYYQEFLNNPHYFVAGVKQGSKKLVFPQDVKVVLSISSNTVEEIIIEAEDIYFEKGAFFEAPKLKRVVVNEGKSFRLDFDCFRACPFLKEVIFKNRDYFEFCPDCFSNLPSLKGKAVEFPYGRIDFASRCFSNTHLSMVYLNKETERVENCFDSDTVIYIEGDAKEVVTGSHLEKYSQDWDGNPHHRMDTTPYMKRDKGPDARFVINTTYQDYLIEKEKRNIK